MTDTFELSGRPKYTGAHVTRRQDDVLLSGRGTYVAEHAPRDEGCGRGRDRRAGGGHRHCRGPGPGEVLAASP